MKSSGVEPFRLFQSKDERKDNPSIGGLGFLDCPETPLPSPPPSVEVLPSEGSSSVKYTVQKVDLGVVTLLKGRVSTQEVFKLSNSDLVPGKYEGGLKLWEGSLDLVKALDSDIQKGNLSFEGKRVLEGAAAVHFQDFNAEVLQHLTIANVNANLPNENSLLDKGKVRYFAGDWSGVQHILPYAHSHSEDTSLSAEDPVGGYNVILMAETVYSISTLHSLYELIKKCIRRPHGVVYMAAKKYYFGVGGGSRRFLSIVEKDGVMTASLIAEVADGSSNVREVWKLSFK
ncbi:hypothetical protein Cgig2_019799 [Carnegiea gigantea]|uniref:protein-histidine N-methyltransferase n=1 Tax=Carnegiea gigantea TaxID=171969 RepID=A0A9Q1JZJ1_9CARY|nr:hypothetical protein Cgig2_019799 [Carnegiea gigantea]